MQIDRLAFDEIDRRAADGAHDVVFAEPFGTGAPPTKPSDGSQPIATAIGISLWPACCQAVT